VRRRKKVRRPASERVPLQLAQNVNEVWSMDFVSDSLANGRRIKFLTVADDFSHECVDISVDWGISGLCVTRLLDRAALFRGYPVAVRTDNGPEFTSRAFMAWANSHGVRHILIQPGRPMQNGYIESFNGKFRDEHLHEQWFETLQQARSATAIWRQDYTRSGRTAAWVAYRRLDSPSCIASALAMQLTPPQPPRISINLATRTSSIQLVRP
jgi:putative transposase